MLAQASAALASEDLTRAAEILQNILLKEPRNLDAQTLAGITADKQDNPVAAEKFFSAAAKIAPNVAETRNNYGAILLRLNKKAEAAKEFSVSLRINPNQRSALVNLAQIRFDEANLSAAWELFEKARQIAPDAEILRALVIISLQLNETTRAAEEFKAYFAAPVPIKDASLGELLLKKNLLAEASRELEFVLSMDTDNIGALAALSEVYEKQKNNLAAGKLLESAVARGLTDARIYAALADVYQAAGYPENAIPAMRLAIEKDEDNESYRVRYGFLLIDSKAPAAAAIRLAEAIQKFPKSARLRMLLGIAQYDVRKSSEAKSSFESVLAIEPRTTAALGYLATIFAEQGKFDQAVEIYEKALSYDEKNAVIRYLIADTLLKTQNPSSERVERELKRAIELEPKLATAYALLGLFYTRQGRWEEARSTLEHAVEIAPKAAEALYQLGLVYARLKMPEKSKATLAKFKELNVSLESQTKEERANIVRRLVDTKF